MIGTSVAASSQEKVCMSVSEPSLLRPRSIAFSRWLIPSLFLVMALAATVIDIPISQSMPNELPRPFNEYLEILEMFGHGFGVVLIIIAVAVLDRSKWRQIKWVIASSLGSGIVANLLKLLVHRARPRSFFELGSGTFWETFSRQNSAGGGMQSFPSSHTATAVGLAVMLAHICPQGRWYFWSLAIGVGIQRIASQAHFPSDVLVGAAVGYLIATICAACSVDESRRIARTRLVS
jgi:membrane-associated phospholipid phosphatase